MKALLVASVLVGVGAQDATAGALDAMRAHYASAPRVVDQYTLVFTKHGSAKHTVTYGTLTMSWQWALWQQRCDGTPGCDAVSVDVIADGTRSWLLDHRAKTVICTGHNAVLEAARAFMAPSLTDEYVVTETATTVELVPRAKRPELRRVVYAVTDDGRVQSVHVVDQAGDTHHFDLDGETGGEGTADEFDPFSGYVDYRWVKQCAMP